MFSVLLILDVDWIDFNVLSVIKLRSETNNTKLPDFFKIRREIFEFVFVFVTYSVAKCGDLSPMWGFWDSFGDQIFEVGIKI